MRMLAVLLLTLLLGLSTANAQGADDAAGWAEKLRLKTAAERRIAQAHLARMGLAALPALERLAGDANRPLRRLITETVGLSLLKAAQPGDLSKFPALQALCEADIRRTRALAKPLAGAKEHDSGELGFTGLSPFTSPPAPLSPVRKVIANLSALHGVAVPAALDLCADASPVSRLYGAEILTRIGATSQRPLLDRLATDPARVVIFHGDYHSASTVGEEVKGYLRAWPFAPASPPQYAAALDAEAYLIWLDTWERALRSKPRDKQLTLINTVRQEAGSLQAKCWDDYWRRARPVLEGHWAKR